MNKPFEVKSENWGNYYSPGADRILAKLAKLGIDVPPSALLEPEVDGAGCSHLEHALMDWFEGRDYDQAQRLIHDHPHPPSNWHVVHILDDDAVPRGLHELLCPSKRDAVVAALNMLDHGNCRIDSFRKKGRAIVVSTAGSDVVSLEPVELEPFDEGIRDRVRAALKGVRRRNLDELLSHLQRLPGFKKTAQKKSFHEIGWEDGGLALGFPQNWTVAMRRALRQVGIEVKQHQAQELVAVFFGASCWRDLVRQRSSHVDADRPVSVSVEGRSRYYHTTEEALFAVGKAIEAFPEPLVVDFIDLRTSHDAIKVSLVTKRAWEARPHTMYDFPTCSIETAANDYFDEEIEPTDARIDAATLILAELETTDNPVSMLDLLHRSVDSAAVLEGALLRDGISPEHIVKIGDHLLAVSYRPHPDGAPMQTAFLEVFKLTSNSATKVEDGDISIYKAKLTVVEGELGDCLEIRGDYGHKPPVRIPNLTQDQLDKLLALTHREDLFVHNPFRAIARRR